MHLAAIAVLLLTHSYREQPASCSTDGTTSDTAVATGAYERGLSNASLTGSPHLLPVRDIEHERRVAPSRSQAGFRLANVLGVSCGGLHVPGTKRRDGRRDQRGARRERIAAGVTP